MTTDPRDELIEELRARVAELEQRVAELEAQLHSAAPFRRRESKRKPPGQGRPPGRPPGHPGAYRVRPSRIDAQIHVPLKRCPICGGQVHAVEPCVQYIEEIPLVRPIVTELTTECGCCPTCGLVRSSHPLQTSTATGAAGNHLGPRALALAALLNKHVKLTMRATCRVLKEGFGLSLTAGGLAQAVQRVSQRLAPTRDELIRQLRESPAVHVDETSWWLENRQSWLWVFTDPATTLYRIDDSRGRQVVLDMLTEHFSGTLISDCLASYERLPYRMQKCYAHHLKAIADALRLYPNSTYLQDLRLALKAAMILKSLKGHMADETWRERRTHLERSVDALLRAPPPEPMAAKVANRLLKRRAHLFTFLDHEEVDATNNRAERALRPAVIARKLSCGNRSRAGADAFEILASVTETARQRGQDIITLLCDHIRLAAAAAPAPER